MKLTRTQNLAVTAISDSSILEAVELWAASSASYEVLTNKIKSYLTVTSAANFPSIPVEEMTNCVSHFTQNLSDLHLYQVVLSKLARDFYEWKNGCVSLKFGEILRFQHLLGEINTDPILCYAWTIKCLDHESLLARNMPFSVLLSHWHGPLFPEITSPFIAELKNNGLSEIHRHHNGSSLPHLLWQGLLQNPRMAKDSKIIPLLYSARDIRNAIVNFLDNRNARGKEWGIEKWDVIRMRLSSIKTLPPEPVNKSIFLKPNPLIEGDPAAVLVGVENKAVISERGFLCHAFQAAINANDPHFHVLMHVYLIIQNIIWAQYIHPRVVAKGFNRFDTFSKNTLRSIEEDENKYHTFRMTQAARTGGVSKLEVRVSPSGLLHKLKELSDAYGKLVDLPTSANRFTHASTLTPRYGNLLASSSNTFSVNKFKIGVVPHFIRYKENNSGTPNFVKAPYSKTRTKAWFAGLSLNRIRNSSAYGKLIVGLDVANSEYHARPEAFTPTVKYLRDEPVVCHGYEDSGTISSQRLGLTYHAGEDFAHILSGMRTVDEAVKFLRMGSGDRLGHALALGLKYSNWVDWIGGEVFIASGEWLDNLVWFRSCLVQTGNVALIHSLDSFIEKLSYQIYNISATPTELLEAWQLRGDSVPQTVTGMYVEKSIELDNNRVAWRLHELYSKNIDVRKKREKIINVLCNADWNNSITEVQDFMLISIKEKQIAIEINPTSNLCISVFDTTSDHPVFRWDPPFTDKSAIRPIIVVGSDDPGIFATELVMEYAFLARAAEKLGTDRDLIERWLLKLSRNSKMYSFVTEEP
ncbi:amidohydrolase family protein [Geomesophilobacter sediminis]|uniref:Adenosine deaminase domain-containing protein n=1 Tax=Geomesophilobacter sediminis TaxID=2798584 RepID=A0A8J7M198_9BACT|nr:hypothetical protein [Geomesophilobacter sediminis]MBJ6726818.1 hypothetical protein [Geomesophilobacter sediminis]